MITQQVYPLILGLLVANIIASGDRGPVVNAYDWTCNLFCYNKGVCRHGHGKFGSYAGIESEIDDLPFEKELHDNGMYCTCPEGYTGLQCEIKYVTCGRDKHTCFNGSSCVKERSSDNGNIFYRCECDAEGSVMDASYAGKYCEHIATVFCDKNNGSFCTNGGRCKSHSANSIATHNDCDCPDNWEGDHCEIKVQNLASVTEDIAHEIEKYLSKGEIIAIVIGVTAGLLLLAYIRRNWFGSKGQQRSRGTDRRRVPNKKQETRPYSDTRNVTRDII